MKIKHLIFSFLMLGTLAMPAISLAQDVSKDDGKKYTLLEQLPLGPGGAPVDKVDISTYLSQIFRLVIMLAGAIAVFQLIYAGFIYMSTDAFGKKNDAKKVIQNTLGGLALVLGSWIIVATITGSGDTGFLKFDLNITSIPSTPDTNGPGDTGEPGAGASSLTQEQVIAQFGSQIKTLGPIKLAGLQQTTIDELLSLKNQCGCTVVVTSATGAGHAETGTYNHANGYKVDLRSGSEGVALSNFITKNYPYIGKRSDGALQYQAPSGAIYALESSPAHWDVLKK